ncbi:hypothetical protein P154DRAFT_516513 [Amniculicola lignicola CBS 123094]|uniref:peptidylprolyl isomerase n=1 Tax=Amniculicola lignicola CBS 123094 TaxID=1392246 RepID=A0A6A5X421_9PLEO|nr:hypothetical protein P154DRAFT_516513 [Amniculicola lignicola CBS 123094]
MRPFAHIAALPWALLPLVSLVSAELGIEVTKAAECSRKTLPGDTIHVHYRGTLLSDGSEFDSSFSRNKPFAFKLGAGQVIKGWDQGLMDMCIGEGRKLTIPPALGYGNNRVGSIPAGSTLIFETELMAIDGVEKEDTPPPPPRPTIAKPEPATTSEAAAAAAEEETQTPEAEPTPEPEAATTVLPETTPSAAESAQPAKATAALASPMDADDNGECHLLGSYALLVQGALGLLAVSSLVYKRWRESPRRPIKIWFFDASKQVFGSVLLHLANILMSMLSSGSFDVASKTQATPQYAGPDDDGKTPNPCSFYLLNLAIDTTIGIPILVLLLKVLHRAFLLTPLANPPESIRSGNYGHPARATWWLKQSIVYFLGLFGMKFCVFLIFQFLPWIAWVGDWALRWTEGNEALQITFVMFVFPLIMNAMQYWIIDGFIKEQGSSAEGGDGARYEGVAGEESDDESDEDWLERHRRERGLDGGDDDIEQADGGKLKEANPMPIPVREYDPEVDGMGSGEGGRGSPGRGGKERTA